MSNKPQRPPLDKHAAGGHDESVEVRLTRVETIVEAILKTQEALQRRLDESLLSFHADMHASIESLRAEMYRAIAELRAEMHAAIAELRAEINELRKEMRTHMRWLLGLCATNTLALIAMIVKSGNFF